MLVRGTIIQQILIVENAAKSFSALRILAAANVKSGAKCLVLDKEMVISMAQALLQHHVRENQ